MLGKLFFVNEPIVLWRPGTIALTAYAGLLDSGDTFIVVSNHLLVSGFEEVRVLTRKGVFSADPLDIKSSATNIS